jgi:hypothetical protein
MRKKYFLWESDHEMVKIACVLEQRSRSLCFGIQAILPMISEPGVRQHRLGFRQTWTVMQVLEANPLLLNTNPSLTK